jgi:hypothetical protein
MNLIDIIASFMRIGPSEHAHLPVLEAKKPVLPAPAPPKPTGPVLVNAETRLYAFPDVVGSKRVADAQAITADEAAALAAKGYNNHTLNQGVKNSRREGLTASETAKRLGCSLDYAKKIGGVLSRFEVQNSAN